MLIWLVGLLSAGCAGLGRDLPASPAAVSGMQRQDIRAGLFTLTAYVRISNPGLPLRVYIEGDGRAWITRTQPSNDPTPRKAVGLALALADDWPNVVYLARPCQYRDLKKEACDQAYWSNKRFSAEVIDAMNAALDMLGADIPNRRLELVGYSGGAAVAALLAAERHDVISLRTVAGNLDHAAINRHHRVSPMPESLNPIDVAERLKTLPQLHFVGGRDEIVPAFIAESFRRRTGGNCATVEIVAQAGHETGWSEHWPELLQRPLRCTP